MYTGHGVEFQLQLGGDATPVGGAHTQREHRQRRREPLESHGNRGDVSARWILLK